MHWARVAHSFVSWCYSCIDMFVCMSVFALEQVITGQQQHARNGCGPGEVLSR